MCTHMWLLMLHHFWIISSCWLDHSQIMFAMMSIHYSKLRTTLPMPNNLDFWQFQKKFSNISHSFINFLTSLILSAVWEMACRWRSHQVQECNKMSSFSFFPSFCPHFPSAADLKIQCEGSRLSLYREITVQYLHFYDFVHQQVCLSSSGSRNILHLSAFSFSSAAKC